MRTNSIQGLRVLLSGGTSGLGKAMVGVLIKNGAKIATFARHKEACLLHPEPVNIEAS